MDVQTDWVEATRARNILTLEERVRAIREFDRQPVYQKVADIMNCSAKQIRNIVTNRESILLYYASKTGNCQGGFSKPNRDRDEKIELLNRVMYEWIKRTQSRQDIGRISTKLIRTIALDVKNHLKVPSFYPNSVWLETFMQSYDVTEDDLLSQNVSDPSRESRKHLSLKISDIVDDVVEIRIYSYKDGNLVQEKKNKMFEIKAEDDSSLLFENSNSGSGDDYDEVRVVIEDDDEENDYLVTPSKIKKIETKKNTNTDGEKIIESYEEALRHLKPLEDFVLLEENFRAIGVISQLESIFRNPNRHQNE